MKKNTLVKVVRIDTPNFVFSIGKYKGIENDCIIILDNKTNNYTQFNKDFFKVIKV